MDDGTTLTLDGLPGGSDLTVINGSTLDLDGNSVAVKTVTLTARQHQRRRYGGIDWGRKSGPGLPPIRDAPTQEDRDNRPKCRSEYAALFVRSEIADPDYDLRAGMFATFVITFAPPKKALAVLRMR